MDKQDIDKLFREQARKQQEHYRKAMEQHQQKCPHIAGCIPLSSMRDPVGRTSIVWHESYPDKQTTWTVGICSNCQRIFQPTDPDYGIWFSKTSFNRLSKAGIECPMYDEDILLVNAQGYGGFVEDPDYLAFDDSSPDPNEWSTEKLNLKIATHKADYLKIKAQIKEYNEKVSA